MTTAARKVLLFCKLATDELKQVDFSQNTWKL